MQKNLKCLLDEFLKNIVLDFEPFISSGLRWGSRFASRHFLKPVI